MQRVSIQPRLHWQDIVTEQGLLPSVHHQWCEDACYTLSEKDLNAITRSVEKLQELLKRAMEHVSKQNRFAELGVPAKAIPVILKSWENNEPSLFTRLRFAFDNVGVFPKFLGCEAEIPVNYITAALIQKEWQMEVFSNKKQFNMIRESTSERFSTLKGSICDNVVYFAYDTPLAIDRDADPNFELIKRINATADLVGLKTEPILMGDIGLLSDDSAFVDLNDNRINTLFKVFPWRQMFTPRFGDAVLNLYSEMQFLEPIWKMMLCDGLLPVLWELNPGHENLLPAYTKSPNDMKSHVCLSAGSRIDTSVIVDSTFGHEESKGVYAGDGVVYREFCDTQSFGGNRPVIDCWIIGDNFVGIEVKETPGLVLERAKITVPHIIE